MPDHTQFAFQIAGGGGTLRHETEDTPARTDETDAGFIRTQFDVSTPEIGGGIRFEGYGSDRDEDLFVPAGAAGTEAFTWEVMPYLQVRPGNDWVEVPIRFGFPFQVIELESPATEVDWFSFGVQFEAEPTITLFDDGTTNIAAFASGGIGGLATYIEVDGPAGTTDYESAALNTRGEGGIRFWIDGFEARVSYLYRGTFVDESEIDDGTSTVVLGIDNEWHGLVISAGLRF